MKLDPNKIFLLIKRFKKIGPVFLSVKGTDLCRFSAGVEAGVYKPAPPVSF